MLNVILFGAPGSGKGTQSAKLVDEFGFFHISTGEVLRDHICRHTDLGKIADRYISRGQLIPDNLMISILEDVLENNAKDKPGVIFDGFPRTVAQADALRDFLAKRGDKVDVVIGLDVPDDELTRRMLQRGIETGRTDDNLETIKRRLEVYHNQTQILKDYYEKLGKYLPVNGSGVVDEIFADIADGVEKHTGHSRRHKK